MSTTENCDNCGGAIGKLETPMVWQQHTVCAACHAKLSGGGKQAIPYAATQVIEVSVKPKGMNGLQIIGTIGSILMMLAGLAILAMSGGIEAGSREAMIMAGCFIGVFAFILVFAVGRMLQR